MNRSSALEASQVEGERSGKRPQSRGRERKNVVSRESHMARAGTCRTEGPT